MAQYDEAWKQIIEKLFKDFIWFYMPDLAQDIDFSKGCTFLEQEFRTIAIESDDTKRYVDKLIKVYLKDGQEQWICIHVEVQFAKKTDFPSRMFRYFYRIYDKYNQQIVSLCVFTGDSQSYQKEFKYDFYRTKLLYEYRTAILNKYDEEDLISQDNPFALVTLAVKYGLKSKTDEDMRYNFKKKLIMLMARKGYSTEEIKNIFDFIEIILELEDNEKNKALYDEIRTLYQKEGFSMVITKFHEMAKQEERIEIAKNMLKEGIDIEVIVKCTGLSKEKIIELDNIN
jgi:predicted transposase/invertase (TIGR01784 family)